jgi:fructose-1,6-bisphosphatase/inositol monophosphatase family enzyme
MAKPAAQLSIPDLVAAGLHATRSVFYDVSADVNADPDSAFEELHIGKRKKKAIGVDHIAETTFKRALYQFRSHRFSTIKVHGEESLRNEKLDLHADHRILALVDAIDGSDLMERGLGNWCTATVFFEPTALSGKRILAAFVGLPSGDIYYAFEGGNTAFVKPRGREPVRELRLRRRTGSIRKASICFYGQKVKNFLPSAEYLRKKLGASQTKFDDLRLYNLGGIPMMIRMIDKRSETGRGIDAVFEVVGQKPHDVVAGAYLAMKAGAVMLLENGSKIRKQDLEEILLKPASGSLKYVLAVNGPLAKDVHSLIFGEQSV